MIHRIFIALFLAASSAVAQDPPPDAVFRASVQLVTVAATVRNSAGDLERGLVRDDFEVLEEGVPQPLRVFDRESGLPLSVALLLDASLSTARELKLEKEAAIRFIRGVLRPQDRMALFTFTDVVTQESSFTADLARLERAIRSVEPRGGTSLFDAIYLASDELHRMRGRKVIVVISDGGDTTSDVNFHRALRAAQDADAVIYSVVIVPIRAENGRNIGGEHALAYLSDRTGGRAFMPDAAVELDPAFAAIAGELRAQYVLGFYATGARGGDHGGAWRNLKVRVRRPGFTVRARTGYYSGDR